MDINKSDIDSMTAILNDNTSYYEKTKRIGEVATEHRLVFFRRITFCTREHCLRFVPEQFRTQELCSMAVGDNGWNLQSVPEEFKNEELCLLAIRSHSHPICFIPERLKTPDFYVKAVNRNKTCMVNIPRDDNQVWLELIKTFDFAYRYTHHPSKQMARLHKAIWEV